VQAVEALRVGQAQVEQHAFGVGEQTLRLRERAGARQDERRPRLFEQCLDEQGVAVLVLDQEDTHGSGSHQVGL
jgi:hypothetical protein